MNSTLLLYSLLVLAIHLTYMVPMLLNAFQNQSHILETYKQYTPYYIHLIQLQPHEVGNIGIACWLFHSWHICTRWSNLVDSEKPFVAHLPGVLLALEDLIELNLTSKTRNQIHGAICYVSSFTFHDVVA